MKKPKYPVGAALCGRLSVSPQRGSPTRHQGSCPEGATSSGRSPGRGVDSYMIKPENLSLTFSKTIVVMLNLVLNLIQYWFSISICPVSEILKRVQDDIFKKFRINLVL
jgi:hypothetical protein